MQLEERMELSIDETQIKKVHKIDSPSFQTQPITHSNRIY